MPLTLIPNYSSSTTTAKALTLATVLALATSILAHEKTVMQEKLKAHLVSEDIHDAPIRT